MTAQRDENGRFKPGQSGNPKGRQSGDQQTAQQLLEARTPGLIRRALDRAEHDDTVLAAVINLMASHLSGVNAHAASIDRAVAESKQGHAH